MRHLGKAVGVATVGILGSLIYLAPGAVSEEADIAGNVATETVKPGELRKSRQYEAAIRQADEAYAAALTSIRKEGPSPISKARLKAADEAYFDAVMGLELAENATRQLARIQSADNGVYKTDADYQKRAEIQRHLAAMKAKQGISFHTTITRAPLADPVVTGSIPPLTIERNEVDPVTRNLVRVKEADDARFAEALKKALSENEKKGKDQARIASMPRPVATTGSVESASVPAVTSKPKPKTASKAKTASKVKPVTVASKGNTAPVPAPPPPAAKPKTAKMPAPKAKSIKPAPKKKAAAAKPEPVKVAEAKEAAPDAARKERPNGPLHLMYRGVVKGAMYKGVIKGVVFWPYRKLWGKDEESDG